MPILVAIATAGGLMLVGIFFAIVTPPIRLDPTEWTCSAPAVYPDGTEQCFQWSANNIN